MAVYVDEARNRFRGMVMCHMMADSLDELHAMAEKIGMRREWFQPASSPHYDLSLTRRKDAIAHGALLADRHKIVELIRKYRGVSRG